MLRITKTTVLRATINLFVCLVFCYCAGSIASPIEKQGADHINMNVSQAFWDNWWFRFFLFATIVSLLIAAYRMRINMLKRIHENLELQVASRTQEVLQQKDQLFKEKELAEQQRENAEKARHDIALLSEIGQEISASLDISAIQKIFYSHVTKLMDADIYGIGMVEWEEQFIIFDQVIDCGHPIMKYGRSLNALEQPAVRCVLDAKEMLISQFDYDNRIVKDSDQEILPVTRIDGGQVSKSNSGIYVPMMIKEQVIGVITVLSLRPNAYHQIHLDMLRTLGNYVGVALEKAAVHQSLKLTQAKLVEQEKMAALGSLVAGIAHELNTPIGNSLLVTTSLRERNSEFANKIKSGTIKRSEIDHFNKSVEDATAIIWRNLEMSAQLVSSFKQIAVDQTSNNRRQFNLAKITEEINFAFEVRLKRESHELCIEIPENIVIDSFPGAYVQVVSSLITNAIVHGFEGRPGGFIKISAATHNRRFVVVQINDNGKGIQAKNLSRIFDPFFTTHLGQGSSGLGLHICYNLVHSVLGGSISVQSEEGKGCTFIIEIPLQAPEKYTLPEPTNSSVIE